MTAIRGKGPGVAQVGTPETERMEQKGSVSSATAARGLGPALEQVKTRRGPVELDAVPASSQPVPQRAIFDLLGQSSAPSATAVRREGKQASIGLDCTRLYKLGDKLPTLGGLPKGLQELQAKTVAEFEADPKKFATRYADMVSRAGGVPTFSPDEAKGAVAPEQWLGASLTPEVKQFRASGSSAVLHAAAHATAQLAFLQQLDALKPGPDGSKPSILVTNGGCGAGKSYALKTCMSPEFKNQFGAIWDSAGEQAGLDNKWILAEAEKRGIKTTIVYVHADPVASYGRAVTKRFEEEGRLVNHKSFAESYVDGAANMKELLRGLAQHKGEVELVVVNNAHGQTPTGTVFTQREANQAQSAFEGMTKEAAKTVSGLQAQLAAAMPATLPDYARQGLTLLG